MLFYLPTCRLWVYHGALIICTFIQQPAAITAINSLPSLLCIQVETGIQLVVAMVNDKQLLIIANMRPVSLLQHLQAA